MRRCPDPRGGERNGAWIGFCRRDHVANGLPRRGVWDRQDVRIGADQGYRCEIGFWIVIDRLDHQAVERNRAANPNHRVAVVTGVSGNIDGEMAAGSGFVFYDDLLSPKLRESVGNDAGADIGSAARRESDQQSHRTRRVDLGVRGARQRRKRSSPCRHMQKISSWQLHDETPGADHTRSTAKLSLFAQLRLVRRVERNNGLVKALFRPHARSHAGFLFAAASAI
jgi:hypothetical protein